jgi:hypothetical protein
MERDEVKPVLTQDVAGPDQWLHLRCAKTGLLEQFPTHGVRGILARSEFSAWEGPRAGTVRAAALTKEYTSLTHDNRAHPNVQTA